MDSPKKEPSGGRDNDRRAIGGAEVLLFGSNSIEGTVRMLIYIVIFTAIGATLNMMLS